MIRMKRKEVLTALFSISAIILLIISCGGGGSSTDSGASSANYPYAGTYRGPANITVTSGSQAVTDSVETVVIIDENGFVDGLFLADVPNFTCTGGSGPTQLTGSSFSFTESGTCTFEDGTSCTVTANLEGTIDGQQILATNNGIVRCAGIGQFFVEESFNLQRQ